jgi:hypothetical protein
LLEEEMADARKAKKKYPNSKRSEFEIVRRNRKRELDVSVEDYHRFFF